MDAEHDAPKTRSDSVEITSTACVEDLDCVEAYDTDEATYVRFESRDRAAKYGSSLDDGVVVNYIVMNFAERMPRHPSISARRWKYSPGPGRTTTASSQTDKPADAQNR
ncbi:MULTISPECIES: hypothetical protein [unclassified Cryobacterium]|uniref:hypothetical protein n=1 Tax=unclassified Cryobacterium TaxID=2649013 RepID=UPI0018CAA764|nr:hypothetical protein [Cryobacterium sp. CAN_C3]